MSQIIIHNKHPIKTVQPNGQLEVNCTDFGCTVKCGFEITPVIFVCCG